MSRRLSPFTLHGRAMAELGRAQGLRQAITALRLRAGPEAYRLAEMSETAQRNADKLAKRFDESLAAERKAVES